MTPIQPSLFETQGFQCQICRRWSHPPWNAHNWLLQKKLNLVKSFHLIHFRACQLNQGVATLSLVYFDVTTPWCMRFPYSPIIFRFRASCHANERVERYQVSDFINLGPPSNWIHCWERDRGDRGKFFSDCSVTWLLSAFSSIIYIISILSLSDGTFSSFLR